MAEARRFRIATSGEVGPARWWWVVIHPDLDAMRAAARAWCGDVYPDEFWEDTAGLCQPVGWWEPEDDPRVRHYPESGYAGVIRFAAGHVDAAVVAHELVHAAVAVYRMNCCPDVRLGQQCGRREEELAYLYGELFAAFQERY